MTSEEGEVAPIRNLHTVEGATPIASAIWASVCKPRRAKAAAHESMRNRIDRNSPKGEVTG